MIEGSHTTPTFHPSIPPGSNPGLLGQPNPEHVFDKGGEYLLGSVIEKICDLCEKSGRTVELLLGCVFRSLILLPSIRNG